LVEAEEVNSPPIWKSERNLSSGCPKATQVHVGNHVVVLIATIGGLTWIPRIRFSCLGENDGGEENSKVAMD
jgi:hypothetical protein